MRKMIVQEPILEQDELRGVTVVLPSLDPDEKLLSTVKGMLAAGFTDLILVDDGSCADRAPLFARAAALPGVTLLRHEENRGKGVALKTAFAYFLENRPEGRGVVTVDGDGQHRPADTAAVARAMLASGSVVLGARDFSLPQVPARSRRGNRITCAVFRFFVGMRVSDTQTGLRAIPRSHLPAIAAVKGERYEYETNMLLEIKRQHIPLEEIKIETVYLEENQSSHFRTVRDSARIYALILKHFLKYSASSLTCALTETLLYSQILRLWRDVAHLSGAALTAASTIPARVLSSLLNFALNKQLVFGKKGGGGHSFVRYYALVALQMLLQLAFTQGVYALFRIPESATVLRTVLYTVVMIVLFFFSYFVQQHWVFADKKEKGSEEKK